MMQLDFAILETYNSKIIAVADTSSYPASKRIENPFLEVATPGFEKKGLTFSPGAINIFNSTALGLTTAGIPPVDLPDGIYRIRYSVRPNYENYAEKTILRITAIKERFDKAFLMADLPCIGCERKLNAGRKLEQISLYLQYALAAAATCNEKLAMDLYRKALKMLDKIKC